MFDIESIGARISALRKAKNLTQMELADLMNISFQAVSNWERGNSMPDISKLPELAEILNVSIGELLGTKSELIENIVSEKTDDYLQNNTVTSEELEEIAPILKPDQVDSFVEKANPPFSVSEIAELLPFINRDVLNKLAKKAADSDNLIDLNAVAPFADRYVLDDIAEKMLKDGKNIHVILPFMNRSKVGKFALDRYEMKGLSEINDFLPFVPKDILNQIAEREYSLNGICSLALIAPFMDMGYLNELAKKTIQKDGIKAIAGIAPFLDKNMLGEFVKEMFLNE